MRLRTYVAVVGLLLLGGVNACTQPDTPVVIHVPERNVLFDEVAPITVTGLDPGEKVVLRASATNVSRQTFTSHAVVRADGQGKVDVRRDRSLEGTYTGVAAMGLLWSMRPKDQHEWFDTPRYTGQKVTITADVDGRRVATASFVRRLRGPGVRDVPLRVKENGFHGEFLIPADTSRPKPAIVVLGGSEGGTSGTDLASLLASRGYPALALGYFDEPGLPDKLSNIPLEYFTTALRWLAKQPGVDPERIVVAGGSRGSEAALLLGAHYPDLVHGVVGLVPSNVVVGGYPDWGPSWTLNGKPLPYGRFGPQAIDPEHFIPVERIAGPVLLICGKADHIWQSCPMSEAIADRRDEHRTRHATTLLAYPQAGHGIGVMVPNLAFSFPLSEGDNPQANHEAIVHAWPDLLRYLTRLP